MYTYSIIISKIARKCNRNVEFPGFVGCLFFLSVKSYWKLRIMQNGKFYFANDKECTVEELIAFMYKINFINARKDAAGGFIDRKYFEDNKYITSNSVDFGYDWEVHPAFRWALYPEAKDIFRYTDIPQNL